MSKDVERLVVIAVDLERARGTTWDTIGQVDGGMTAQFAQKKWSDTIADLGHLDEGSGTGLAEELDAWDTRPTPGQPSTHNQMYGQVFGTVIQVGGGVSGGVHIAPTPDQLSKLKDELNLPVLAFLVNFDNCLEEVGDLQAQLDLIPRGMRPVIDAVAYSQTDTFLRRSGLGDAPPAARPDDVSESLAFLLKVAFERGYFMLHFHRLDYIPRPVHPVDPLAIMDLIIAEGDPAHPDRTLGNAIEVTLRRVISQSTEPDVAIRTLQMFGDGLVSTVQPHLDLWCDVVRSAHAYGILAARAEIKISATRWPER
ncbi:hypothetical protein ADK67_14810 [Saccharothrix sp. NRRL B-16348]|nr:hypothetical protein ADK67_14810 [Saccharothrix sp. NRRL B-16348]